MRLDHNVTHTHNNNKYKTQAACENSALLKLFLFYVFDIVLAYTVAGSFLSKLQQLTQLLGAPPPLSCD